MKNILVKSMVFVGGAAIGSLVTWKIVETKYKKIAEAEIQSVKDFYAKVSVEGETFVDGVVETTVDIRSEAIKVLNECNDILEQANYVAYSNPEKGGSDATVYDKPYVIAPEEFDELDGYKTCSLTYFVDGVLTDDDYNPVEDVDKLVGADFHEHFGEYEDDSVFVRNDSKGCDYEILADTRKYTDVASTHLGYDE